VLTPYIGIGSYYSRPESKTNSHITVSAIVNV
jgi:hypothetical protein